LYPDLGIAQTSKAVLSTTNYEFGIVKQGERTGQAFRVRNDGTGVLTLQLVQMTQPGMTARFKPEIAPGAEEVVRLEWDTSRVKGQVEGVAVLRLNDPLQPEMRLVLKGTVQPSIEFQPFAAVFLSAFRGEKVESSVRILNHEDRPLKVLGLEADSQRFTATVQTVEDGKIYELHVTARPDAPLGSAKESLYLLTDHPEHSRLRVLVNMLIKSDVYANPDAVDFGQVQMTELNGKPGLLDLLNQTLVIKTRRGEMQIKSIHSDLNFLDIRQSPPQGNAATFRIDVGLAQALLRPGPISGSIRITTSDPDFPEITIPVRGEIR